MITCGRDMEAPDLDARVLVVGHGSIGSRHVRNLLTLGPGIVVVEPNPRMADGVPSGLAVYPTIAEALALNTPTHAIVATPASEHGPMMEALENVRSVLIEKPLIPTLIDVWQYEMNFLNHLGGGWSVGYNLRFLPSLRSFREQVRAAPLGRALWARVECSSYAPDWRVGRPYVSTPTAWKARGGGALRECSHEVDMVRWIFGYPTVIGARVGNTHSLVGDADDYARADLSTPYCERVELHLDLVRRDARRRIEVVCEQGTLTWELNTECSTMWSPGRVLHHNVTDGLTSLSYVESQSQRDDIDATYVAEVKALLSDVLPEWADPNIATLEDGLAAVRLVDDIEAASK